MIKPHGIKPIVRQVSVCVVGSIIFLWAGATAVQSRPVADDTLGAERTIVTPSRSIQGRRGNPLPGDLIEGGARRGNNLFHSFQDFQVDAGRSVYFNDPGVDNILARVTGRSRSDIAGTLGVLNGNANLFLINPNGIVFEKGALLDVGGSFVATTSNAIGFGNQGFFNVVDPTAPPLLTVRPSAFLFSQINAGAIENYAGARTGVIDSGGSSIFGLRVPDRQSLLLVGGDIVLDKAARLNALSGQVEVAGIAGVGEVGLSVNNNILHLAVPNGLARADVSLHDQSRIDTRGQDIGSVNIIARNMEISGSSNIRSGIRGGSTAIGEPGDITIDATDRVDIVGASTDGRSAIINITGSGPATQGGSIRIHTGSLLVTDAALIETGALDPGISGNTLIDAHSTVELRGTQKADNQIFRAAQITSRVDGDFQGGGNIQIRARTLLVRNGANLSASTNGQRNAGDIFLKADTVEFTGFGLIGDEANLNEINSGVYSQVLNGAGRISPVQGGDITIKANSLSLTHSAILSTNVDSGGQGRAGNITIRANHVLFAGENLSIDEFPSSGIYSRVEALGIGNGGTVMIRTGSFELRNGGVIRADTLGAGQAGSIEVDSHTFQISNRSALSAGTRGSGQGGNIRVNTHTFQARNGGQLATTTSGRGNAGNILVIADRMTLSGSNSNPSTPIASLPGPVNPIDSGNITETGFSSGLFANTGRNSSGAGGTIRIRTRQLLEVSDRARVVVNSQGNGLAGNIFVTAPSIALNQGRLTAETSQGNGGNITLRDVDLLQLRNGSSISATAGTDRAPGNGGNIAIDSNFIVAVPNENSDIRADAFSDSGGNVTINTQGLFGIAPQDQRTDRSDITASSELGVQGNVNINTPDVDPSRGIIELPDIPLDASNQISQTCPTGGKLAEALGEFVNTGRGGLPANPTEILGGEVRLPQLAGLPIENAEQQSSGAVNQTDTAYPPSPAIVEAQGWQINAEGKVALIASAPAAESHLPAAAEVQCGGSD